MTDQKNLPLRPNVCMLVINRQGKLFLGERLGEEGHWQFPQGGAISEISLEENVIKELHEELGAERSKFRIKFRFSATHEYEFDKPRTYGKDKWRGQSQTFWLVEFLGEDNEIDLQRFEAEFMNWRWCTLSEVRKLAHPRRLVGYEKAFAELDANTAIER